MLEEILLSGFAEYSLPLDDRALERYRLYADALEETNKVMRARTKRPGFIFSTAPRC